MSVPKHSADTVPHSIRTSGERVKKLEVVVKCDSIGVVEAVVAAISDIKLEKTQFSVIHSGVGAISKSDLLIAATGSKLVVGFNVEIMPKLDQFIRENGVEVRIYEVIYTLIRDLTNIGRSLLPAKSQEKITGKGRVIQLFKTSSKDIILGCEIVSGKLEIGSEFRVISAMGPVFTGRIESMQIDRTAVKEARAQQQVGIKIHGFNKAKLGDLVESFKTVLPEKDYSWSPKAEVVYPDR